MVAVQHDVFRVDIGHGVERVQGCLSVAAWGQRGALERHAFFQIRWEQLTGLQKNQLVVEVTEPLLGLDVQIDFGPGRMALQCLFNHDQQISAADQKFNRLFEHVQSLAHRVFEGPGQADHAVLFDFHRRIVAVRHAVV